MESTGSRVIVDPLYPDRDRLVKLVKSTSDIVLHRPDPDRCPHPLHGLRLPAGQVVPLAGAALINCLVPGMAPIGLEVLAAGGVLLAAIRAVAFRVVRGEERVLLDAKPHYVVTGYLPQPFRDLLHRAETAAETIVSAAVYREGILDTARAEATLPAEIWGIAEALRDTAALTADAPPADDEAAHCPEGERAAAAAERIASVQRRVETLEEWARQTVRADRAYTAPDGLAAAGVEVDGALLDVLAGIERDNAAIEETGRLAGAAGLLADALTARREQLP